jgi:hypothetical protein
MDFKLALNPEGVEVDCINSDCSYLRLLLLGCKCEALRFGDVEAYDSWKDPGAVSGAS